MKIHCRRLELEESGRIRKISASQYIGVSTGKWMESGGFACGAFHEDGALVGFITVNPEVFGSTSRYVLLDQLFISLPHRGRGIGTLLLHHAKETASSWGAEKLYICAGSAEETIAFYFIQGAVEASEINPVLYENDLRDFQLELSL